MVVSDLSSWYAVVFIDADSAWFLKRDVALIWNGYIAVSGMVIYWQANKWWFNYIFLH